MAFTHTATWIGPRSDNALSGTHYRFGHFTWSIHAIYTRNPGILKKIPIFEDYTENEYYFSLKLVRNFTHECLATKSN